MRGEVWTLRDDRYASKARPVVIIQSDSITDFDSVVLCLLTTFDSSEISTRVRIEPTNENGLYQISFAMTDKIVTVSKSMLGRKLGKLDGSSMEAISKQLAIILDL